MAILCYMATPLERIVDRLHRRRGRRPTSIRIGGQHRDGYEGLFPMVAGLGLRTSGHGRDDGDLRPFPEGRLEPGEEPDILLIHKDVHELEHLTPLV